MLGVWFPGARLNWRWPAGMEGWRKEKYMHVNLLITGISIRPESSPTSLEFLITYTPVSSWVTQYRVNVPFFEHIVTSLTRPTLSGQSLRWMSKGFTCNCDIFPFFNISRWVYWYCCVLRRYYGDRKQNVRPAVLRVWARWVKVYLLSDLGSHSLYIDKWLLTLMAKCPGLLGELHLFAIPFTPSRASSPQLGAHWHTKGGDGREKAGLLCSHQ